MKIIAFDQSSRLSGYAIFEDGELIDYGKFGFTEPELSRRLVKIREKVLSLVKENNIDKVYFEDIQLQGNVTNNVASYKVLAEVLGVCEETMRENKIDYDIIHSQTWKATLQIKGRNRADQKRNAQAYVLSTYGISATQDESDAICIGTCAVKIDSKFDWAE